MSICDFTVERQDDILEYIGLQYTALNKRLDIATIDRDLANIKLSYMKKAEGFWLYLDTHNEIIGTVGLRKMCIQSFSFGEVRRFYVDKAYHRQGIGTSLLKHVLMFAKQNNYICLRGTTSKNASAMLHIIEKAGGTRIPQYRESNADLFFEFWI